MPVIHVSPVDHSGLVRCYIHELETTLKVSQAQGNPERAYYCCQKNVEDPQRCDFFYWADESISGTPHQPPPDILMQNNSSRLSRTPQIPRTPASKLRLELIEKALAGDTSDSRVNGNDPFSTPSSNRQVQALRSPGKLSRTEAIGCSAVHGCSSQSTAHSRDANIFRSSQSPPSNFLLSPLLNESGDISDSALEAHDTPTREFRKRTRELNTDEESDYDLSNSPSYKGKKKANNAVFPRDGNVTTTLSSQKLADLMKEFQGYPEYTAKLERQVKALIKSNAAKALKIQELQTAKCQETVVAIRGTVDILTLDILGDYLPPLEIPFITKTWIDDE